MTPSTPIWVRKLTNQLIEAEPVKYIYPRTDSIRVHYKSGLARTYIFDIVRPRNRSELLPRQPFIDKLWPIQIGYQFEWDPTNEHERKRLSKYFNISRSIINGLSFMQMELLMNHLLERLLSSGYIQAHWTRQDAINELEYFRTYNPNMQNDKIRVRSSRKCRALIERYQHLGNSKIGWSDGTLNYAYTQKRILYKALQKTRHETAQPINITTINKMLYKIGYGPNWQNPSFYRYILDNYFDISKDRTIVDIEPALFEKALTALMLGCKYATADCSKPPQKLISELGLRMGSSNEPYDIAIFDNILYPVYGHEVLDMRNVSNELLIFVRDWQTEYIESILKPTYKIPIKLRYSNKRNRKYDADYFFVYK